MSVKNKYKLVIFDVDGVIVKSDILYYEIAKRYNTKLDQDEISHKISRSGEELFSYIFGENYTDNNVKWFRRMQIELFEPRRHLYNGISDIIKDISKYYRLAIVSNKPEAIIRQMLSVSNIFDSFERIIGRDTGYPIKPSPDGINCILEDFKIDNKSVIYFGDSATDCEACKSAQVSFAHCKYGFDTNIIPCDYELEDINQIRDILNL